MNVWEILDDKGGSEDPKDDAAENEVCLNPTNQTEANEDVHNSLNWLTLFPCLIFCYTFCRSI